MNEPVIIIGGGGHARVIAEAVRMLGATVLGHTEVRPRDGGADRPGFDLLGDDRCILEHAPDAVVLANGLGSVGAPGARRDVFVDFLARGYRFPSLVHPAATVSFVAPPPTSRKFAGSVPASLITSIVAMAKPAPLTIHPMSPSSLT